MNRNLVLGNIVVTKEVTKNYLERFLLVSNLNHKNKKQNSINFHQDKIIVNLKDRDKQNKVDFHRKHFKENVKIEIFGELYFKIEKVDLLDEKSNIKVVEAVIFIKV